MTKPKPKGATEPLIAALLARLPTPGEPWAAEARAAWLRMFAGALDVVYDPQPSIIVGIGSFPGVPLGAGAPAPAPAPAAPPPPAPPKRSEHQAAGCDFYVDLDGYARCDFTFMDNGPGESPIPVPSPQRRVNPDEITGQIYEYRRGTSRDRETVTWADDTRGALPGMEFCGPG